MNGTVAKVDAIAFLIFAMRDAFTASSYHSLSLEAFGKMLGTAWLIPL